MGRFHIRENGDPGSCSAAPGNCPLGGDVEHYEDRAGAMRAAEAKLSVAYSGGLSSVKAVTLKDLTEYRTPEAKELIKADAKRSRELFNRVFAKQPLEDQPMTRLEDKAMGEYKWSGYGWMNRYLRGDASVTQATLGMGTSLSMVDDLQGFIKRQPPVEESFNLYRAGGFPELKELSEDELEALERGEPREFELKGFVSTSTSEGIFRRFHSKNRVTVKIKPGTRMLAIDKYGVGGASLAHESELLLPHGTRVKVTKLERKGAHRMIELEIIPESTSP